MEKWLTRLVCVSLFLISHFSFLISSAQDTVPLCSDWVATVDGETQQIVLRWRPSPGSTVMGYHICSGSPCVDYDTVFGRLDTTYICLDHSSLERHSYRLHVFDSAYNVSQLTPHFGNMVLSADIPDCQRIVDVVWTPYEGMPDGLGGYYLMAMIEPMDTDYVLMAGFPANVPLQYSFDIPDSATQVHLKVLAYNVGHTLVSQSNIVSAGRSTAHHANSNSISAICFDSVLCAVRLEMLVDPDFCYTLWRSVDGSPWAVIDSICPDTPTATYIDRSINRFNSLHCYQLSVKDDCGMNEQFSDAVWITVPDLPPAGIAFPNIIVAGSEANGSFCPALSGIMGDIYELYIYSRNGLLVYSTNDPFAAWQPSKETPQGAYTYTLRVRFNDNKIHTYIGTFLLIR